MAKVLTVENLTMKFDEQTVFENLNFALKKGSMTALLGPNGAGKTTLIRILMNMLTATAGVFKFSQNTKIGYVPQFRNIDSDYPLSIRAFIELNTPLFKSASVKKRVDNILKETNLLEIQNTRMGEASGGQKQRAYLAQALLDEPNFIILDEATASLDPVAKEELMTLIKHLNEKHGLTVLFTTHDIPLAKKYMKDYLLFKDKNLEHNKISQLTKERMNNVCI